MLLQADQVRAYTEGMEAKTPLEKYVAAGKEFTETSLKRAQIIIRDLAREGENGREHAEGWAEDFVQRAEGVHRDRPQRDPSAGQGR